ncbi:MAG: hypothetical protein H6Q90_2465 [Deltaproteobacteria bacterium]|nr:hypothetical protein [Deltaproteobacteria bacterium]
MSRLALWFVLACGCNNASRLDSVPSPAPAPAVASGAAYCRGANTFAVAPDSLLSGTTGSAIR